MTIKILIYLFRRSIDELVKIHIDINHSGIDHIYQVINWDQLLIDHFNKIQSFSQFNKI